MYFVKWFILTKVCIFVIPYTLKPFDNYIDGRITYGMCKYDLMVFYVSKNDYPSFLNKDKYDKCFCLYQLNRAIVTF